MSTATLEAPEAIERPAALDLEAFHYGGTYDPAPPELDQEALAELAKGRGREALAELLGPSGPIVRLDGLLKSRLELIQSGQHPSKHIDAVKDIRSRRQIYQARAVALAGLLKTKPNIPPAPAIPAALEFVSRFPEGSTIKASVDREAQKARQQLTAIEAEIGSTIGILGSPERYSAAGDGTSRSFAENRELTSLGWSVRRKLTQLEGRPLAGLKQPERHEIEVDVRNMVSQVGRIGTFERTPARWPQDGFLIKLGDALARQRELRSAIAENQSFLASGQSLVAARVKAAVESAGGDQQILADLREALISAGKWREADPEYPQLTGMKARMSAIMTRLDGAAAGSTTEKNLRTEHAGLISSAEALEPAIELRRLSQIGALLASASTGLEDARDAVEQVVRTAPAGTFPTGFAEALADARFDRAAIDQLAGK